MIIEPAYHVLSNGLRVVLHRDAHIPIVCVNIAYRVGSKDESPGKTGFAHLFEHLMFDGSANVPRGGYDRYCEQAGGYNNAYTSEDKTCYHIVLPSNQLELGLWLESDRLLQLMLTPDGLETQRSVVMEEKRQRVDNQPYGTYDTRLAEMLFSGHPYGHPVIGSMDDIAAATMCDVETFHATYYQPNNAALALAGDFDPAEALELIERYFGTIPSRPAAPRPVEPALAPPSETRAVVHDAVPLAAVFMGYRIPREAHDDFILSDLLSDMLGNGESSRLHHTLVYEQQIASQASAYIEAREHTGMLTIFAVTAPDHGIEELERAIDQEIGALRAAPPSEEEMRKILHRVEYLHHQGMLSFSTRADRLAHYALFYNDPLLINVTLHKYLAATPEELHAAARAYLDPDLRVVLHYLPVNGAAADAPSEDDTPATT